MSRSMEKQVICSCLIRMVLILIRPLLVLGFGDELSVYNSQYVFEPSINYNNTFGDHEVSGLVLFNAQDHM